MLRAMTASDIINVVRLEQKVLKSTLGEKFYLMELENNPMAYYFVYELSKMIVGFIGFRIDLEFAEMMNFCVHNEYQNQGIGTELLTHGLLFLKDKNVKQLTLEVRKSNTRSIRFYIKHGFIKSHIRKDYYENHEDAYVYIKEVSK